MKRVKAHLVHADAAEQVKQDLERAKKSAAKLPKTTAKEVLKAIESILVSVGDALTGG